MHDSFIWFYIGFVAGAIVVYLLRDFRIRVEFIKVLHHDNVKD